MDELSREKKLANTVATIRNEYNPEQVVDIVYMSKKNAFITSGIKRHFEEKEILVPAYLVVSNFQLIGAIISSILEKLSQACDKDSHFRYVPHFEVMEKKFALVENEDYVVLEMT